MTEVTRMFFGTGFKATISECQDRQLFLSQDNKVFGMRPQIHCFESFKGCSSRAREAGVVGIMQCD